MTDNLDVTIHTDIAGFGAVATALLKLGCSIEAGTECLDTVSIDATIGHSMPLDAPLAGKRSGNEFIALVRDAVEPLGGTVWMGDVV